MGVKDRNVIPTAILPRKVTEIFVNPAINQTSIIVYGYVAGYRHQLVRASSWCRTKAGAVTYVVKVGGRVAVAAGAFGAGVHTVASLSATLANLQGSATDIITIEVTTDGTGAVADGRIFLEWRPRPLDGEAGQGESS